MRRTGLSHRQRSDWLPNTEVRPLVMVKPLRPKAASSKSTSKFQRRQRSSDDKCRLLLLVYEYALLIVIPTILFLSKQYETTLTYVIRQSQYRAGKVQLSISLFGRVEANNAFVFCDFLVETTSNDRA